ncbi:MAG TPA: DUF3142 domain-containing protein [Rhodocyclaceae bacterium]|nr:DUF3142 domain-containing protein [Rhodocyclaceae bacterium]
MTVRRLLGGLAAVLALCACSPRPPQQPLVHDAYVWQRRWAPPVAEALRDSADLVGHWRILAAEVDARGRFRPMPVDLAAVAASGRPAIPVIRIEAPLAGLDRPALIADIAALERAWQASPATVAGLEIDHDSSSGRLADYARILADLRPALGPDRRLSVTLLPDWLDSPGLDQVLAASDEAVLQLHSLHTPAGSLFHPSSAWAWTAALARRTPKPFRVALPDYGSRIVTGDSGRIEAVESEAPVSTPKGIGKEVFAPPATVAAFLRRLEKRPPPGLSGVVWFRLPVSGDTRAWTARTWRAVVTGGELPVKLSVVLEGDGRERMVVLSNTGEIDGDLPATLVIEAPCRGLAAHDGYILEHQGENSVLVRAGNRLLRAGSRLAVGKADCTRPGTVRIEN